MYRRPDNPMEKKEMNEILRMMRQQQAESRRKANEEKRILFAAMKRLGVKKMICEFDGSGDSGNLEPGVSPDNPAAAKAVVDEAPAVETGEWKEYKWVSTLRKPTLGELAQSVCYSILEAEHGGWEINEGAFGTFTISSGDKAVSLEYNQRIESIETSEEDY